MRQLAWQLGLMATLVLLVSVVAHAVRWSPAELDVVQESGTEESYRLILQNDTDEVAKVRLYVADWLRDENGVNDFGVPVNGARWILDRSFAAGESVTIRYTVRLPDSGSVAVSGSFLTGTPQIIENIGGPAGVSANAEAAPEATGALVSILRSIEAVDETGLATIALELRTAVDFDSLTIEEVYETNVELDSLEAHGGQFDTINRSCADWVTLSYQAVQLEPEESVEITMTVATPDPFSGMHWCILMAESEDVVVGDVAGTRIVTRPSVGLKLFVSAPSTLTFSGSTTEIDVVDLYPLTLEARFANTGNAQLVVTGQAQVVDQTGEVIRDIPFTEYGRDYFRILPDSQRTVLITDLSGSAPLPTGIYQAIVSFDFGGDALIAGVKAFRVR